MFSGVISCLLSSQASCWVVQLARKDATKCVDRALLLPWGEHSTHVWLDRKRWKATMVHSLMEWTMLEKLNFIHTSFSVTMTLKAEVFCLYSSQSTKEQIPPKKAETCISYALSLFDKHHELPIIISTQIWQEPELSSESKAASFPFFLI